jgi:hypothetical protein
MSHRNRIVFALYRYAGGFKLLSGIATLGAATAILALSGRRRMDDQNSVALSRLVPVIFGALSLLFLTRFGKWTPEEPPALEKVRTG